MRKDGSISSSTSLAESNRSDTCLSVSARYSSNDRRNASRASQLLEEAREIAKEKGFRNLATKIETEQSYLTAEFKKWQELIDRNASLLERINMVELESFIKEAIKLRDMTLENQSR